MASKITFSLFLVLFVFMVKAQELEELERHANVGNDIDKILHKLRKIVDESLVKAQKILDEAKAKVNQIAQKVENAARNSMKNMEEKFKKELDGLKEKAKKAGVNIDACLGENEKKLVNLPNQFSDDMVHCVSDRINEGIGYAQDALNKIKKIVDDVENIKKKIKACGHGWKSVKCLAKLAARIEREVVSLPTQIEADAAAAAVLITQLDKKIEKCASDKTKECASQGESLLKTIGLCVASKIIIH